MKKLVVGNPLLVRQSIRLATGKSRDHLLSHQMHCILLTGVGCSCHEIASWFGDSTRTIERWVGAYNRYGEDGLRTQRPTGRPPRLPAATERRVAVDVSQPPQLCGYRVAQWEGPLLMRHLTEHYGVSMGLRQCQRILQRLARPNSSS